MAKTFKLLLGNIGENMVIDNLTRIGWHAFNLNSIKNNFKAVDIAAVKLKEGTWTHKSALIQVKTLVQDNGKEINFPSGFDIAQAKDKKYLEENIKGPYVFVVIRNFNTPNPIFDYYVLSRCQMIDLLFESNKYYLSWKRDKPIKEEGVIAGITLSWIQGKCEAATEKKPGFQNPLADQDPCLNNWDNIENEL